MELLDKESLILSIGDLKLSDTEYTFDNKGKIGNFEYVPLGWANLAPFVSGDYRIGTRINQADKALYHVYAANRSSSNACELALGYFDNDNYYFIKEGFGNIYSEKPELLLRSIVCMESLYSMENIRKTILLYRGKIEEKPTVEDLKIFKNWLEYINVFKEAFSKQNLDELSKIKRPNYRRH